MNLFRGLTDAIREAEAVAVAVAILYPIWRAIVAGPLTEATRLLIERAARRRDRRRQQSARHGFVVPAPTAANIKPPEGPR